MSTPARYRRLLDVGRQLAATSPVALSHSSLATEFLELASARVEMRHPVAGDSVVGSVELSTDRRSRMPPIVERLFTLAIKQSGVDDTGTTLLIAASIDAIRSAAIAAEPTLLREEDAIRLDADNGRHA